MSLERVMRSAGRIGLASVCVSLAALLLSACGSGGHSKAGSTAPPIPTSTPAPAAAGKVVARVGGYSVTQATLNQWMAAKIGEGFYEVATHVVPAGLVSEPSDIPRCVTALKALTPIPGKGKPQPQPTAGQLMSKCEELQQAIKAEALTYLVSSYWSLSFDAQHGIEVSEEEVRRGLSRIEKERYRSEREFQQYLFVHRRTLPEDLFMVRMDLLQQKVERKLGHASRPVVTAFVRDLKRAADTADCRPGYVVEFCRGYEAPTAATASHASSPSVLLEEIARWRPETSHGFTGLPIS